MTITKQERKSRYLAGILVGTYLFITGGLVALGIVVFMLVNDVSSIWFALVYAGGSASLLGALGFYCFMALLKRLKEKRKIK